LLDELKDLLDGNHTTSIGKRFKIVVTSRPHIQMDSYFRDVVEISLDKNNLKDIADYVHASGLGLGGAASLLGWDKKSRKLLSRSPTGCFSGFI
jgi:hypothetical protein